MVRKLLPPSIACGLLHSKMIPLGSLTTICKECHGLILLKFVN